MKAVASTIVIALFTQTAHPGTPAEWVFDGALPPGATLERATPRLDSQGNIVPADTPVFSTRAVLSQGAQLIAELDPSLRILAAQKLTNGLTATLVKDINQVYLTFDTPGLNPSPTRIDPHSTFQSYFGVDLAWGLPTGGEIFEDGTVLIFTNAASSGRIAKTIRTSVTTFDQEDGMTLVRSSVYVPPRGGGTTQSPPWFTRKTFLPNLNKTVSTIAEYSAGGLTSTAYPGDGRSLGYGSSDAGLTWQRLIDTDDPLLGRNHVIDAKHLHHVEPFEWWDQDNNRWNIGAIGCLGDGNTASGILMAFSSSDNFDDPAQLQYPIIERRKTIGVDMLTDLFAIDPSHSPGDPLRFIQGPDTSQAGIIESTIDEIDQTDRYLFRPATTFISRTESLSTLCGWPYIFQLDRMPNGSIVAPTMEIQSGYNPNGIWISDTSGEHWTTAYQAHTTGYSGVMPISATRFWTADRGGNQNVSELWIVSPPVIQQCLQLGVSAEDFSSGDFFLNAVDLTRTDVTSTLPPPDELPDPTTIWRLQSTTIPTGVQINENVVFPVTAQEGQLVSLVTWVKPGRNDLSVASFNITHQYQLPDDSFVNSPQDRIELDTNDWTRIVSTNVVPAGGIQGVRFKMFTIDDASATMPFDCYFTKPQIVVSDQPIVQAFPHNAPVAGDQLSIALPPLGTEWTVEINLTEELALACSLVDASEKDITIQNNSSSSTPWQGIGSFIVLSPNFTTQPSFSIESTINDVFMPTQTKLTIVMSQPNDVLKMYVNRGMGDTDGVSIATESFTPKTLRLATPDWSRSTQGALHSVRAWANTAIDLGPAPLFDPCPNDANADGTVDVNDISYVLFRLGDTGDPETLEGDVNNDGTVDVNDISGVIFNFGPCPTP